MTRSILLAALLALTLTACGEKAAETATETEAPAAEAVAPAADAAAPAAEEAAPAAAE
ncbi:MAG: hypothetical protein U1C48_11010 [Methylotenera sp.]|nr:hypothetical protein [Methylotenera sp.]